MCCLLEEPLLHQLGRCIWMHGMGKFFLGGRRLLVAQGVTVVEVDSRRGSWLVERLATLFRLNRLSPVQDYGRFPVPVFPTLILYHYLGKSNMAQKGVNVACRVFCEAVIALTLFSATSVAASYAPHNATGLSVTVLIRATEIAFFFSVVLLLIGVVICLGFLCFHVRPPKSLACCTVVVIMLLVMLFSLPAIITAAG